MNCATHPVVGEKRTAQPAGHRGRDLAVRERGGGQAGRKRETSGEVTSTRDAGERRGGEFDPRWSAGPHLGLAVAGGWRAVHGRLRGEGEGEGEG